MGKRDRTVSPLKSSMMKCVNYLIPPNKVKASSTCSVLYEEKEGERGVGKEKKREIEKVRDIESEG